MPLIKQRSYLKPGKYFMQGDEACAEGAVAAGCNFFAGYPITPASEIMEIIVKRFHESNRVFVQMEDEIASMAAIIGAAWTGSKTMTASSGPGMSLKMENLGYGIMTETPCVIADVQRVGPSTGQATRTAQGDIMQARWGTHGEHTIIAISPWSVEEIYYETIRAFNLSEKYRTPVIILMEEASGHIREIVEIKEEFEVFNREKGGNRPPFGGLKPLGQVPPMPSFGEGKKLLVTGSTHDPNGYRKTQGADIQRDLLDHLCFKIEDNKKDICEYETYFTDDMDTLIISYGFAARAGLKAVKDARDKGKKAGFLRLKTIWPMPDDIIRELGSKVQKIIVPEMNYGQLRGEIHKYASCEIIGINRSDGEVIEPRQILEII